MYSDSPVSILKHKRFTLYIVAETMMTKTLFVMKTLALAVLLTATVGLAKAEQASPNGSVIYDLVNGGVGALSQENADIIRSYNNFTPELIADSMLTSLSTQRVFRDALPSVADYTQTAHRQSTEEDCGYDPTYGAICRPGSRWVTWDTPFMQMDKRKRNDGYLGYDYESSGFATGITRLLGDYSAIGLAVGYDYRHQEGRDGYFQKVKGDAFHSALYGGTAIGCLFLDGYAGFSWTSQRSRRLFIDNTAAQTFNDYRGNYNDTILSAGLKASYVWALPGETRIIPAIGFDFSRVSTNSFTEKGAGTSRMHVNGSDYNSAQMPITIAASRTFRLDFLSFGGVCSLWTPEVRGGWVPQFGSDQSDVTAISYIPVGGVVQQYAGKYNSTDIGSSYGTVGAGLKIQLANRFIFGVDYDYRFGDKYSSHILTGTYGMSF